MTRRSHTIYAPANESYLITSRKNSIIPADRQASPTCKHTCGAFYPEIGMKGLLAMEKN
jgi:hypothetical protein